MTFSDEDISNFLTELLELGGSNEVDRNSEKFIRNVATNEVEEISQGSKSKKLAIYGTQARDVVIVNPFADGDLGNQDNWFCRTFSRVYTTLREGVLSAAGVTPSLFVSARTMPPLLSHTGATATKTPPSSTA